MSAVQKYVARIKNLPSLPTVAIKVSQLLNDPNSSAKDFDAVIAKDPALTAKLLKLVNSAYYALPYKVESISRAVSVVGFKQVRDLVNSVAVIEAFKDFDPATLDMRKFWEHSLACGVAGRVLSIFGRQANPDVFSTAGLLHDVGKLILLSQSPTEYTKVAKLNAEYAILGYEAELKIFGFSHADVGAELCRLWNHPEALQAAVAFHHNPQAAEPAHQQLTATTHIANIMAHACQIGSSGDQFVPPLNPAAWGLTGLKLSVIEPAVDKIYQQVEEIVAALLV